MKQYFVPYTIAFGLKEISFDEPCYGFWDVVHGSAFGDSYEYRLTNSYFIHSQNHIEKYFKHACLAPLYDQVIDWFKNKYNIDIYVNKYDNTFETFVVDGSNVVSTNYRNSNSRKEALNKGIQAAVKLIKQNKLSIMKKKTIKRDANQRGKHIVDLSTNEERSAKRFEIKTDIDTHQ
jgi:hypothetical protein